MKFEIGDKHKCPTCSGKGAKIVWISEDGKTIGVECPSSNAHKKNAVTLKEIEV